MELFEILESKKDKIRVEIETKERLLNPFSTLKVRFKENEKTIFETETILKCENLHGCFVCFNKDLTVLSVEKGRKKLSFPIAWKGCLTYLGRPIFEQNFFEIVKVKNGYFYGYSERKVLIENIEKLEVEKGFPVRVVLNGKELFCERIEI